MGMLICFALLTLLASARSVASSDCIGTISSLSDVSAATVCTTVNIDSFVVPVGQTLSLDLLKGTTINLLGDLAFGVARWNGPLVQIKGEDIEFNGNGHRIDSGGPSYWDGLGGKGGATKPDPMMAIHMSREFSGGHGVLIGSISSDTIVDGVVIRDNTITNSVNGFRIKTDKHASNSRVSNVTYSGDTATNCTEYGVLITQNYPETIGTPGNGVTISGVSFIGSETKVSVESGAHTIVVNCGKGSCAGTCDWSGLSTSGGTVGTLSNCPEIAGYTL